MSCRTWVIAVVALTLSVVPAVSAAAAPDETVQLTPGTSHSWEESADHGFNLNYFGIVPAAPNGTCSKSPETYCDTVLVELSNPLTSSDVEAGITSRTQRFSVNVNPVGGPTADYDLVVWQSDAEGKRIYRIGSAKTGSPMVAGNAVTTEAAPSQYILVDVVYWVGMGEYTAEVAF